ncbi:FAD-binding oxidoreductase, partial [Candidatus Saccharibacteria bacterium]|nr:FAD-binding oxidoreductase [Candidatus Saccharibacteria bacterium]
IISEVILRTVPLRTSKTRVVGTFKEIGSALKFLQLVSPLNPRKLDLYDLRIIMEARESGKNLDGVIRKLEEGYVVFTCFDEKGAYNLKKIAAIREKLPRSAKYMIESKESKLILDEFENSLTHYLQNLKDGERVPILTGFYLPEWNIESFLHDLRILGKKLDLTLELYGSYANSVYNLRPKFNLSDTDFNKKAATFLKAGAYIIDRQSGELAAGEPEGRLKAIVTNEAMLEPEKELYTSIKEIFDPNNILNPDVKLGANSKFVLTHFRNEPLPKIVI